MDTVSWVSLALQLAGIVLALAALLWERIGVGRPRDTHTNVRRSRQPGAGKGGRRRPGVTNPWRYPLRFPRYSPARSISTHGMRKGISREVDAELTALTKNVVAIMKATMEKAADAWEEQLAVDQKLRDADEELRTAQLAADKEWRTARETDYRRLRVRVNLEMVGLFLVAVGTVLGSPTVATTFS